jgi:hypothetical protein
LRPTEFHIQFDRQHDVVFDLIDHPVATAWSYLLLGYWNDPTMYPEQINFGWKVETYTDAVSRINSLAEDVGYQFGSILGDDLCKLMTQTTITRDDLNTLHHAYETIQHTLEQEPANTHTRIRILTAQALNETVHYVERFFKGNAVLPLRAPRPRTKIRMVHEAFGWSSPVMVPYRVEDYELFELYQPGRLYLTYTGVGKPPLSVFRDQDVEEEPRSWSRFGPSFNFTLFGDETKDDFTEAREWLSQHTGRGDWVLGDPRIGDLRGDPDVIWKQLGSDPKITDLSFVWQ